MSFFDTAIGLIAPPLCVVCKSEGSALCKACAFTGVIPYGPRCFNCGIISPNARTCEKCRTGSPRYVWVSTTYENAARELLKVYKFGHQRIAANALAGIMAETLLDFVPVKYLNALNYRVVPVPTATSRIRQRSFDHAGYLANNIGRELGLKRLNAISRIGQKRQLGAPRARRIAQPQGSYFVRYPNLVAGKNILLIDDVVTTGATLRAVTKTLRTSGATRVDALVFAKRL